MSKKQSWCVYCRAKSPTTKDHIIPRSLLTKPYPADLPTVPACSKCNQDKSKHEEYFRELIAMSLENSSHPIALSILEGPIKRAMQSNRSKVLSDIRSHGRFVPMFTPNGIYAQEGLQIPIEAVRINKVLEYITRGLYYRETRQTLPQNAIFTIFPIEAHQREFAYNTATAIGVKPIVSLDSVFACVGGVAEESPITSVWLMCQRQITNDPDRQEN